VIRFEIQIGPISRNSDHPLATSVRYWDLDFIHAEKRTPRLSSMHEIGGMPNPSLQRTSQRALLSF